MEVSDLDRSDAITANKFRNVYGKSIRDGIASFTYDSETKTGYFSGLVKRGDKFVEVNLEPKDKTTINILLDAQRQADAQKK
jgi:hypothetical protein